MTPPGARAGLARARRWLPAALGVAYAAEMLLLALSARSIIDEGVFLTAGRLVAAGERLYADFPFSQGPLVPYAYGLLTAPFDSPLLAGRGLSWLGALVTGATGFWLARRFGGRTAGGIALVFAMANLPLAWVSTTVRTQALATPLVLLAAAALATPKRSTLAWAAAPSLLLWSTAARIPNALAFVAVCGWVGWQLRGDPRRLGRVAALLGAQGLLAFAPLLLAPSAAAFHLVTAQTGRGPRLGTAPATLGDAFAFPFAPASGLLPFALLALGLAGLCGVRAARGWRPSLALPLRDGPTAELVLLALGLLLLAPHLLLDRPHLAYFVSSSALFATGAAIGLGRIAERSRGPVRLAVAAGVAVLAASGLAHRETFVGRGETRFSALLGAGRELRALAGPGCTMATFQTQLAVAADCAVLPGLEYSVFSFFPELPDAEAAARGVLNPALLEQRIAALRPELLAFSSAELRRLERWRGATPAPPGRAGLPFPPAVQNAYRLADRVRIASGMWRPAEPDGIELLVFARRDLLAARPAHDASPPIARTRDARVRPRGGRGDARTTHGGAGDGAGADP